MSEQPHIILGIDPGTLVMGYGLIAVDKNSISLVEMGVLQLSKHKDHAQRLELIFRKMETLIKAHKPKHVAIEAPFYGKNVQSMLKLGRAQGVAIAASMMHGLNAVEYAPKKIKQAITGRGGATKEQVWQMLQHTIGFEEDVRFMDATDALAVALCHHYQRRQDKITGSDTTQKIATKKKKTSWESFINDNPGRVK